MFLILNQIAHNSFKKVDDRVPSQAVLIQEIPKSSAKDPAYLLISCDQ